MTSVAALLIALSLSAETGPARVWTGADPSGACKGTRVVFTTGGSIFACSSGTWAQRIGGTPGAAAPTFSPVAGTYTGTQSVSLSSTTPGPTIRYTTNGTDPTGASPTYSTALSVAASGTIKAFTQATGYTDSAIASAAYVINVPVAAAPTASPAAGTYSSTQSVTLSSTTSGATIRYTTNGTTPNGSSPVYSTPISVATTETIKAYAAASGYTDSSVSSHAYTINVGSGTVAACATEPIRSTGTTYYYCACGSGAASGCQAGTDGANPCTNPSSPCSALSAAATRFNGTAAGNTVALCRGGAWSGSFGNITNTGCSAANPCDFRDYAPSWGAGASNPRPILAAGGSETFIIGDAGTVAGIRIWNLDSRSTNSHLFVYGTSVVRDLDFCGNKLTGGYAAINFQSQGRDPSNNVFRDNEVYGASFAGFFGGSPGIQITGNYFEGNGTGDDSTHSVYLISHCPTQGYSSYCGTEENVPESPDANVSTEYVFANNHIVGTSDCLGAQLVVHGVFINNHLRIENNLIETASTNASCYGMQLSGGNSGAYFGQAQINRNRFFAPGNAAEMSCCVDCVVASNVSGGPGDFVVSDSSCSGAGAPSRGTYQNNTVYAGQFRIGTYGTGPYNLDSNAVWTNSSSCVTGSLGGGRNTSNYCRTTGGASATTVFVDPTNSVKALRNFTPASGSPLIGAGSSTYYATTAIGTPAWSTTDTGASRSPPIDAGALVH